MNEIMELDELVFGPILGYVKDDDITDIDWDGGSALWLKAKDGSVWKAGEVLSEEFVNNLSMYVANHESRNFNRVDNVLSAETKNLRITFAHESLVRSGRCFSIRKTLPYLRISALDAIQSGYCDQAFMHFCVNAVKAHMNIAFCGEPGAGKTECAKFFSSFIDEREKVITVEDTLEWRYGEINAGKRYDSIKVNDRDDYVKSIKLAMRLNPSWLMLSEARGEEVKYLLMGWSTGVRGMTTIHTDDVRNIPDRMINMTSQVESSAMLNNIYSFLNLGILLTELPLADGRKCRKIWQAGVFFRENGVNKCQLIVEDGVFFKERIPEGILMNFKKTGIHNPIFSEVLCKRIEDERRGIIYGAKRGNFGDSREEESEELQGPDEGGTGC